MIMKDIENLLEKYYEGETSLEEEKQLREFFQGNGVPDHLESHAAQFRFLADLRNEQPTEMTDLADWNEDSKLKGQQNSISAGKTRSLWSSSWQIAASVALLVIGFAGGTWYNKTSKPASETTAARPEVLQMKKVLQFDHGQNTSASERILAVNQSYELPRTDHEITQILINTMNFDGNVNVRLAACEALFRLKNEPGVRQALVQSLQIQTDPNVQITLIDILVQIKERRAVEEMQRLMEDKKVMKVVRLKAEQGLGSLI
jgi:hypothetical protein